MSIPALDFTPLIASAFTYVNTFITAFSPMAAVQIGLVLTVGIIAFFTAFFSGIFRIKR